MQKTPTQLPEIKLVGITARTNNANNFSSDPALNVIVPTVQKYFHNALAEQIHNRKTPGTTYCVYTDYESDYKGDYTYFIGEEVSSFDNLPDGFTAITIPAQNYVKFTNGPGAMPAVCIDIWQDVWENDAQFGGKRRYLADFEIYDERASDHSNVVLDVYVGIKSE